MKKLQRKFSINPHYFQLSEAVNFSEPFAQ